MTAEKPFTEPTDEMLRAFYGRVYPAIDDHQKRWDGKRISALLDSGLVVPAAQFAELDGLGCRLLTKVGQLEAERDALARSVEDLKCWSANERRRSEQRLNALTEAVEKVLCEVDPLTNPVVADLRAALNQEEP